jgi:mRNA interferase HicA
MLSTQSAVFVPDLLADNSPYLALRTLMCDAETVKVSEFLRRVQRLARARDLSFHFDASVGKGSHGRLRLGSNQATIKDLRKELGEGLLNAMCKQLGIDKRDLY